MTTQIQQHTKRTIDYNQLGFIAGPQGNTVHSDQ